VPPIRVAVRLAATDRGEPSRGIPITPTRLHDLYAAVGCCELLAQDDSMLAEADV
jgi:hypothetical protein